MANSQLERIAGLVERLGPIDRKQRGMRIEAAEWNALVDILRGVLQVDRVQEESTQVALEQRFAPTGHGHLGEVNLAWLDADLQARAGGQQSSVLARTALADMDKKIQSLGADLARLAALAEAQQKLIDRATVDELDRSRALKQFETRFAGMENLRTLVTSVASDVEGVRTNVNALVELRKSLSDAQGNPIDVAGLKSDLTELARLRDNLKGVDGELLRLRDIEVKIKEVADAAGVGGPGGLDKRLADLSGAMEGRLNTRVDERSNSLKEFFGQQSGASETRLREEFKAAVDARGQEFDQSVAAKLAESETRLSANVNAKVLEVAEAARRDATDTAKALIESRLATVPDQVRATTAEMIARFRTDLGSEIRDGLDAQIQTRFTAIEAQVNARAAAVESRFSTFEQQIPTLVGSHVEGARAALETALNERVNQRVEAIRAALQQSLNAEVKGAVATAVGDLDGRVNTALAARLSGLDEAIARSVAAATRNLPEQLSGEVRTQIVALDVSGQIKAASENLALQLRTEQAAVLAQQQARLSEAVNSSVTLLRGEISALSAEFNGTVDARLRQSNDNLRTQFSADLRRLEGRLKPESFRPVVIGPGPA